MAKDVIVVGGGNAGLVAAISAREAGANVLLLETAQRLGVRVEYEAAVSSVDVRDGCAAGVRLADGSVKEADAVVLTSGGFEANIEWLKRYWGDAADNYVVRGTPENDGRVLASL